jgi:DNA topoisomerase-2
MNQDEFKRLDDRDHVLQKPGMYIGSVGLMPRRVFFSGKPETVSVCPGLLKIISELVDNSIDEHIRSKGRAATEIRMECSETAVRVTDNGRGIPVRMFEGELQPAVAWTALRAGTSFNESQTGPSSHGVGSSVTNIFSKKFVGETHDGKNSCTVVCSGNLSKMEIFSNPSKKTGTTVYCEPDFTRFEAKGIDETHQRVLRERLRMLSVAYPGIKFFWNGENASVSRAGFISGFSEKNSWGSKKDFFWGFFLHGSEEFLQFSAVNGLELPQGGTHIDFISREFFRELSLRIKKSHKLEIPVQELKKSLGILFIMTGFRNPSFNSQTKECLVNTEADIRGQIPIDFCAEAKKLCQTETEIIETLVERFNLKQELRGMKAANKKAPKKLKVDKYVAARSNDPSEKILFLTEGDSASGSGILVRDTLRHGFFPLRGMPLNIWGLGLKKIFENVEFQNIRAILGLGLDPLLTDGEATFRKSDKLCFSLEGKNVTQRPYDFGGLCCYYESMRSGAVVPRYAPQAYGKIGIMTDADLDGSGAIRPLLMQFLFLWPELFVQQRVQVVNSPIIILTKCSERLYFFTKEEYMGWLQKNTSKGWEHRYIKGLGTLRSTETEDMLNDSHGRWVTVEIDDPGCFRTMFSEDVEARRELMEV